MTTPTLTPAEQYKIDTDVRTARGRRVARTLMARGLFFATANIIVIAWIAQHHPLELSTILTAGSLLFLVHTVVMHWLHRHVPGWRTARFHLPQTVTSYALVTLAGLALAALFGPAAGLSAAVGALAASVAFYFLLAGPLLTLAIIIGTTQEQLDEQGPRL